MSYILKYDKIPIYNIRRPPNRENKTNSLISLSFFTLFKISFYNKNIFNRQKTQKQNRNRHHVE